MKITTRIAQGLTALVVAVASAVSVGAMPAHAADHFTIDNDGVVVGQSSVTTFQAFNGNMESWHDGNNIRATLTGTFQGRGDLTVTFIFSDEKPGGAFSLTRSAAGAPVSLNIPSPSHQSVVRFTVAYTATADSICPAGTAYDAAIGSCDADTFNRDRWTGFVGDSPQSVGNCNQLDTDNVLLQKTGYHTVTGTSYYRCTTTGGIVWGHFQGKVTGTENAPTGAEVIVTFTYASGTVQVKATQVNLSPGQSVYVDLESNITRPLRTMKVEITGSNQTNPTESNKFGYA